MFYPVGTCRCSDCEGCHVCSPCSPCRFKKFSTGMRCSCSVLRHMPVQERLQADVDRLKSRA